jgi:DNA helicase II / ATP-dependent DNA helicase PcrA
MLNTLHHNGTSPLPPTLTPSAFQQAIYDFISDPLESNAIVEAVAGSGKTTTIINASRVLPPDASSIFLAFNKASADELRTRGVNGSTFHAMSLNALRGVLPPGFKIEGGKVAKIFRTIVDKALHDEYSDLPRLIGLGKNIGIGVFPDLPNKPTVWLDLLEAYDLNFSDESKACNFATRILDISNADKTIIDFDDMLYMNVLFHAKMPHYDFVFVDEAQDTNAIQLAILRKITIQNPHLPPPRFIFVGDRHQAIYGFRGAGTNSMDVIEAEYSATHLPLSVSYRCPKSIVRRAQEIVPQITAADFAIDGTITSHTSWKVADIPPDAVVLCRNTKPLIRLAYDFIRDSRKVQIVGNDIGASFKGVLKLCKAPTLADTIKRVEMRKDSEIAKTTSPAKVAGIIDRYDSLLFILSVIDQDTPVYDIPKKIDALFADHTNATKLSTVHKAKGQEWDEVFILDAERLMPSKWAHTPSQLAQESNLIYVAITRAKSTLHFIESANLTPGEKA